ncbi:hypothetical protein ACFQ1E_04800 [Sphingomonas canadensis]|uniref:Gamma-glutamyltranspeptidase n=1 Tax=Sphingomonas canadensis TaxID=1219257 RepID=A0ABW3H2P3_9SPHN|nr:hypothetical protein [Sphingomonas canadensis]MCW3834441.1 hypothetical protein [Sphingomonas canadensis]
MSADRRTLLKALSALPLAGLAGAGVPGAASAQDAIRIVADRRLPGVAALASAARRGGHAVSDPGGEIVAHVLAQGAGWLRSGGPVMGLTSYTDMMLMRDLAREAGRPMRFAAAWNGGGAAPLADRGAEAQAALIAMVRRRPPPAGTASVFLWLV